MFYPDQSETVRPTQPLAYSLAIHGAVVTAIFVIRFAAPAIAPFRSAPVQLVAPSTIKAVKLKAVKLPAISAPPVRLAVRAEWKLPPPSLPVLAPPVLKAPPTLSPPTPAIVAEAAPTPVAAPPPSVSVAPRVFAGASPAAPEVSRAAQVRTGGFGGASTAPVAANRPAQVGMAGFGGAATATVAAVRGSVTTSGFGSAGVASGSEGSRAGVRSGGFGDSVAAAPSATTAKPVASPLVTAAQILEKPHPVYTEEARRMQIEGEVQLEVLFAASGEIRILRVVRGLGHGLDENAVLAAKGIRFRPAQRDGRAVDSTATVHITFQLAS